MKTVTSVFMISLLTFSLCLAADVEVEGSMDVDGNVMVFGNAHTNGTVTGYIPTASGYGNGVYGNVWGSGTVVGVEAQGIATAASSYGFGLRAWAVTSAANTSNTGVYAIAGGGSGSTNYAGYFDGNVTVTGTFSNPSDAKFKEGIKTLEGGLSKVMALRPTQYRMKVNEFKDQITLSEGSHYGLVAQEVEKVVPELVHEIKAPPRISPEELKAGVQKSPLRYKSVDYMHLIPILLAAIQEQQAQIESLQQRLGGQ